MNQYTAFGVRKINDGGEVRAMFFDGETCTANEWMATYSDFFDACDLAIYLARKESRRQERPGLLRRIGEAVGILERRAG